LYTFLISSMWYMTHPSHPPLFDHPSNIWWSVHIVSNELLRHHASSSRDLGLWCRVVMW
jgi:hypothetical protein